MAYIYRITLYFISKEVHVLCLENYMFNKS